MVTTKQKPILDTQNTKELKQSTMKNHQTTKKESKRGQRHKGTTK